MKILHPIGPASKGHIQIQCKPSRIKLTVKKYYTVDNTLIHLLQAQVKRGKVEVRRVPITSSRRKPVK